MPELFEAVPGGLSVPAMVVMVVTVIFAGFLRGFVGFGAALVISMVFSVFLGPAVAVPVSSLSGLPATLQLLPSAVRDAERPLVVPFGVGAFLAAPVGVWFLTSTEPALMRIAISVFVLAMVCMLLRGWSFGRRPGPGGFAGAGGVAGFVQGASGVSGPLAVVVALSRCGPPQRQRANVIGAVTSLNLCAYVPFWYHGLFSREVIVISLLIVPFYSVAIWFGARFFGQGGHRHFRNAALFSLAAIGLVTLALAVRDALARLPPPP